MFRHATCDDCKRCHDLLRIHLLHDARHAANVCRRCLDGAADLVATRRDPDEKMLAIRKALDEGKGVWYTQDHLYVVPEPASRTWRNGSRAPDPAP